MAPRVAFSLNVLLACLAVAATASAQEPPYQQGSGSELVYQCTAYVKMNSGEVQSVDDVGPGSQCFGYVDGFMDGVHSASPMISDNWRATGFCLAGSTMDTMIKVYLAFMEKNPKYLDQDKGASLRAALHDAYPCRK